MTKPASYNTPKSLLPAGIKDMPRVPIRIGGLHVSNEAIIMDAILGSCISACLYDPVHRIGGMNHFMLPKSIDLRDPTSTRYGVYAMEMLITSLVKLGARQGNLEAKIFGGGHVLKIKENLSGVPQQNIEFIRKFLAMENIPVVKEDVGGYLPRRVLFNPYNSKVSLKRLNVREIERTIHEEVDFIEKISKKPAPTDGDALIFEEKK